MLAEVAATVLVIWGSGIASGIVDNITFTATMIPVIQDVAEAEGSPRSRPDPYGGRSRWARTSEAI